MKKLTLEKAQELLEFLKGKAATGDITISQENYLQAMELAVMVLAVKPIGAMCEDGSAICFFDNREVQVQKVMHWIGSWPFYLYSTPPVNIPVIPDRSMLRKLVDVVWNEAKESREVPSTKFADQMIDTVFPASTAKPEAL